jgi:alpha-galactosidase
MFTRGLVADMIRRGEAVDLALVDVDPKALEVAERLTRKMVKFKKTPLAITATPDRRRALKGATAVVCTIGVGGRRAWEKDVFIPRKFGIYQPVGDSVMPGGTARALRMIPAMVAIAKDVLDVAPQALFFNYGNPMGPVCRAVRKATGAPVVGLCHGVMEAARYLAGVLGVPVERMQYTAMGMNHLTWFTRIRADGRDAMPKLDRIAKANLARLPSRTRLGERFAEAGNAAGRVEVDYPFTWELFRLFHAFPAVMDRHVTEFFPHLFAEKGNYYGKTLGIESYSFEGTIAYGDKIYEEMREMAFSAKPLGQDYFDKIGGEHEQVVDIIASIRQNAGRVYSANLPNRGQIPNLPAESIVEGPATADAFGLRAIQQEPLPAGLAGTLATRLLWVETVVAAALEGSREKFIQALLLDGAVKSVAMAAQMADEFLAAHARFLPQFAGKRR